MRKTQGMTAAGLALAAAIGMAPAGAEAQGLFTQPVRGKQAGDLTVGLSAIGVLPQNGGRVDTIGGTPHASNAATAQLDFTYFFTPWLSANLIAATSRHDVQVRGSAIGTVELGNVWVLPPTLTLQVHPLPSSRVSPYLGVGVNYSIFYAESGKRTAGITGVDVRNSFGLALNVGTDIELAPRWRLNLDAKKIFFVEPDVLVNTAAGTIRARADINPWVVGMGVRYTF